jgi:UDP-2,3-diacylglucosamine pyrophosphatase LpxH
MRWLKHRKFTKLLKEIQQPIVYDQKKDKYVIFSDQHIGMPEFDENKDLYLKALDYSYQSGYTLIVLGDYEELHRYSKKELKKKYEDVYASERRFLEEDRYYRIFGNHDIDWRSTKRVAKHLHDVLPGLVIREALKFDCCGSSIFLAHGHQGSFINDILGIFGRIILKYIARPLGVSSMTSPAKRYTKRRKDENTYYNWAKEHKVLFIAGHTHRPMFASLSEGDRIRVTIENLFRKYVETGDSAEKERLEEEIKQKRTEFEREKEKEGDDSYWTCMGKPELITPCYSNDGSCLHANGITCIELYKEKIRLLWLYDETQPANVGKEKRALTKDLLPGDSAAADYKRQILEEEDLEYIFTRIRLLS